MAKAQANISSIESFRGTVMQSGSEINEGAADASAAVRDWQNQISSELTRCNGLCARISAEISSLEREISVLDERIDELSSRLASMDPYIEVVSYDDEGNEHVELVPNPRYEAVRAELSQLRTKRYAIASKLSSVKQILHEAESVKTRLENAASRIESIDGDIARSGAEAEEYSLRAAKLLSGIVSILGAYLAVSISSGSSGSGSAYAGGGNSASPSAPSAASAGGTKTYSTPDGTRVTQLGGAQPSASGRKYTDGVVYEGNLSFDYDNATHTVAIKRKIYQYSPGIDFDYVRPDGRTNREAMLAGDSPIVLVKTSGGVIATRLDLHHVTQQETVGFPDSAFKQGTLAEIPVTSHQKYTRAIHMRYPKEKGIRRSFRVFKMADHTYKRTKDDKQFNAFRKQYWRTRAMMATI